jgi:hypothetical protein
MKRDKDRMSPALLSMITDDPLHNDLTFRLVYARTRRRSEGWEPYRSVPIATCPAVAAGGLSTHLIKHQHVGSGKKITAVPRAYFEQTSVKNYAIKSNHAEHTLSQNKHGRTVSPHPTDGRDDKDVVPVNQKHKEIKIQCH